VAEGYSGQARDAMWASGQATDSVSSLVNAMSAPGSPPALPVLPSRSDLDPAQVTAERGGWRPLEHGEPGGQAAGRWDDVSGRREPWPRP
jgi:hypothetical protein